MSTGDRAYRDFLAWCESRWWADTGGGSSVVLALLPQWLPKTYAHGFAASHLAAREGARFVAFDFTGADSGYFHAIFERVVNALELAV